MNESIPRSRYLTIALPLLAFALSALGILLILEVIRPFHDLASDGPLALVLWGIGALLGVLCFFLRGRSLVLCVLGLGLNVLPLIAAAILWWVLSHSNFAWH